MKNGILLSMVFWSFAVVAYPCPQNISDHSEMATVYQWLNQLRGKTALNGCQIEITICNAAEPAVAAGPIGEVYVIDREGREAYVPVNVMTEPNAKIITKIEAWPEQFHYIKWDHFDEPEFGRTETYRLDLYLDSAGLTLRQLDLGTYSTNKKLHQPNGNQSRWYNCDSH